MPKNNAADLAIQYGPQRYADRGTVTRWVLPNEKRVVLFTSPDPTAELRIQATSGSRAFLPAGTDPTDVINLFLEAMWP